MLLRYGKAQVLSQYGNKALSLAAAAGMPAPLMLLPYLESLRTMHPASLPVPFGALHPALAQLSPTFALGSSPPASASSAGAATTAAPAAAGGAKSSPPASVASMVIHSFI